MYDKESGFYYLRARYYDPKMGRFVSEDTYKGQVDNPLSLNRYTYTHNNPLRFVDPSGHVVEEGTGGIGGYSSPEEEYIHWAKVAARRAYEEGIEPEEAVRRYVPTPLQEEVLPTAIVTFNTTVGMNNGDAPNFSSAKTVKPVAKTNNTTKIAGCNCFTAGTKVLTDEGEKNIEDIEVGDMVLAKDEETGEQAYKEVTHLYRNDKKITYDLSIGDQIIETTENHPFWVEGKGWVLAADLQVGDELQQSNGNTLKIDKIKKVIHDELVKVYNFSVADFSTYYVSSLGIWVHNISCAEINWKGFSSGKLKPHWEKHGHEFGDISQNDYLKLAKGFAAETNSSFKEQVVGNFLVKYDPSSGRVLVGHIKDRQIRTFYKDDGRSADPFQAAIDLAKSLGGG
ncbi:hypothetical protein AV540_26370 [Brevibacillus parabrevis]|nr:hypothetical protein AV540_26370 [Brevibacillus parabrevis]